MLIFLNKTAKLFYLQHTQYNMIQKYSTILLCQWANDAKHCVDLAWVKPQLHNAKTHYVYSHEYFIQWNNILINSGTITTTGTKTAAQTNTNFNHNNATIPGCNLMNKCQWNIQSWCDSVSLQNWMTKCSNRHNMVSIVCN